MRKIYCSECGNFLFDTEKESDGAAGAEAQAKGFVFKMPFMFTEKYTCLFFCNHTCGKSFYQKNVPKNEDASKKLRELRENIPDMTKKLCSELHEIQKAFCKTKKH